MGGVSVPLVCCSLGVSGALAVTLGMMALGRIAASQGQLGGDGIRAALYALYQGERELGFYGLEAATTVDADRLESILRGTWAHNASIDIARVHRGGQVFVVVWHDGVSAACWQAVNAGLAKRLTAR